MAKYVAAQVKFITFGANRKKAEAKCPGCGVSGISDESYTSQFKACESAFKDLKSSCKCPDRANISYYRDEIPGGLSLWISYCGKWFKLWFKNGVLCSDYCELSGGDQSAAWIVIVAEKKPKGDDWYLYQRKLARAGFRTKLRHKKPDNENTFRSWTVAEERALQALEKQKRLALKLAKRKAAKATR